MFDLCDTSRGMFPKIFTAPAGVRVDLKDLQNRVCGVNFTQLVSEWENIIDLSAIQHKVQALNILINQG